MTADPDWRATAESLEKQLQEYDRIMFAQRQRFLAAVYRWSAYSAELEQQICDLERELQECQKDKAPTRMKSILPASVITSPDGHDGP